MANILSIVESISRGTDKKGEKFWTIKLASGDTLFSWKWGLIQDVKQNLEYDFGIQARGNFLHIVSVLPVIKGDQEESVPFDEESTGEPPAEKAIEPQPYSPRPNKDKEIRTQALTKAACAAINGVPFEVFLGMAAGDNAEALAIRTVAIISMVETFEDRLF